MPIPHPQLLDLLFTCKNKVSAVFKDVLGIHAIDYLAVTRIDEQQQIIVFSSTPALEFNLFSSDLWCFDNTYSSDWFPLKTAARWEALYQSVRYDELYYTRHIKHNFTVGLSLATENENCHYIYSLASTSPSLQVQETFINQKTDFYKIGDYCNNLLKPFFPG